jgi:tetratricopeptide (TPR) repeat protein
LGYAWSLLGDFDRSLSSYNHALALNPDLIDAYNDRGALYQNAGRYSEALADYEKALALDPEHRLANSNKAAVLHKLGRLAEAEAAFDKAIADPAFAWTYVERGSLFESLEKYDQALSDYDQAISLEPNYKLAYANKGYRLRELGRYAEALIALERKGITKKLFNPLTRPWPTIRGTSGRMPIRE